MKFNRPNDPAITPAEMAYYQTPATAPSTWRADLARIGIVSGVAFVLGTFATGTAVIFWRSWQTVGVGMWLTVLLSLVPLAVYAIRTYTDVSARHALDQARMYAEHDALRAEHDALLTAIDTNDDGKADAAEVEAFVNYVRRLHRGEPSTAAYAQQKAGIAGPDWTDYKNWLVSKGYANIVARRGGEGFALKPSVLRTPWPKLEQQLRQRVTAGLADGLTINDTRKTSPADRVSTLDD